jgi:sialate O-acetylesterase
MIKSWREKWQQGNFPFYFVQIAPWNYGEGPSHEIREAQRLSLSTENTGMVVTMDIGDNDNIHPANKHDVGDRLAYIALNNVYGKNCDFSGPKFKSQKQEGSKIILSFDYSNGLKTLNGKNPTGFEICGENGKYYNATAVIKGETIEVSAPEVKKPVSVRYLWKNCVNDNQIFNNSNLPSSSFQSTKFF